MENEVMNMVLMFTTLLAPLILGLTEIAKKTINVADNYIPLVSLVIGIAVGAAAYPFTEMDLILRLWAGAIAGLGGTGIYEVFKKRN